eukprot:119463_1
MQPVGNANIHEAVNALSKLQVQDLEKQINLFHNIIDHVIKDPQNSIHRNLKVSLLLRVLGCIWIDILLKSGFIWSENGNRLIFNTDQLGKLKTAKNVLLCWQDNVFNSTNKQSIQKPNKTSKNPQPLKHIHKSVHRIHSDGNEASRCSIKTCTHASYILSIMTKYNQSNYQKSIETMYQSGISNIVDAYIHFLHQHDNDTDFHLMTDRKQQCQIIKCNKFIRNCRDKTIEPKN